MSVASMFNEWQEEREHIRVMFRDGYLAKSSKEELLRRLRALETLLDIPSLNYNSQEFTDWIRERSS